MELLTATTVWLLGVKIATLLAKCYLFARVLTLFFTANHLTLEMSTLVQLLQIWSLMRTPSFLHHV